MGNKNKEVETPFQKIVGAAERFERAKRSFLLIRPFVARRAKSNLIKIVFEADKGKDALSVQQIREARRLGEEKAKERR